MTMIANNLLAVHARVRAACIAAGRQPHEVNLLAVSKTHQVPAIEDAIAAGQVMFGENYIQEAVRKIRALHWQAAQWHCIGPVQSNKTRLVAEHFNWVQSVDRLHTAQRLSEQRPRLLAPLQVCIQVNIDGGPNKAGVTPDAIEVLARAVAQLPRLQLRGLMSIPEPAADFETSVALHTRAKNLFDRLNAAGIELDTLSMGMSADLEAAILAGSTMVRVGSAIFGDRVPRYDKR